MIRHWCHVVFSSWCVWEDERSSDPKFAMIAWIIGHSHLAQGWAPKLCERSTNDDEMMTWEPTELHKIENRKLINGHVEKWSRSGLVAWPSCHVQDADWETQDWNSLIGKEEVIRTNNRSYFYNVYILFPFQVEYPNKYCDHIDLISTSTYEFWYFVLKWDTHMAIYLRGKPGARTASYALIASAAREPTQCSKFGVVPYHTSRLQITVSIDFSLSSCFAIHTF